MHGYDVFVHFGLLDRIPERGGRRSKILAFIRGLSSRPLAQADYEEVDDSQRIRQVVLVAEYSISYGPR